MPVKILNTWNFASLRPAVLEFKWAKAKEQLDASVRDALKQMADNRYDDRLRSVGCQTILHVGVAFFEKAAKAGFMTEQTGSVGDGARNRASCWLCFPAKSSVCRAERAPCSGHF